MENKPVKILAIDDNQDNLLIIKALIYEAFPDYEVYTATSGRDGLSLADWKDPDVILLDVVMPDMDGFEVCRILKADKKLSIIPVVFVTALKGDRHSRIRALEVGGDAFLAKPIDESELVAQVRAMVKIKAANVARFDENIKLAALVAERTNELNKTHTATLNLLEDLKQEIEARKKTEEALHKSEELYRSVIHASPDNITVTDLGGNILMVSPKGLELINYKSDKELRGRSISDFLIPEHRDKAIKNISGMFQGIFNGAEEYTLIKSDGSTIDTEINAEFVRGVNGEPTGLVFAIRDITERKQAQDALRQSEEKYRLITEKISDVVWIMDLTGKSQFVSQSIEKFTGFTVEEYLNQTINERFTPESAQFALQTLQTEVYKYTHEETIPVDYNKILIVDYRCKDGGIKTGEMLITPYLDHTNKLIGVHGVTRDITKRKSIEDALRASEEKYRFMAENTSDVIWHMDMNFCFDYLSPAIERIQGYKPDELIGKDLYSLLNADGVQQVLEIKAHMKSDQERGVLPNAMQFEYETLCKDGSWKWVEVNVTVHFDAEKNPIGFYGVTRDVSERKRNEAVLLQTRQNYETFFNSIDDFLFVLDEQGDIIHTNTTVINRLGYTSDELIGRSVLEVHPPERREEAGQIVGEMLLGTTDFCPVPLITKSNIQIPVETRVTTGLWDGKPAIFGVTKDITQIILSEEKFSKLFKLNPSAAGLSDLQTGRYLDVNESFYSLFGFDRNEVVGKSPEELGIFTENTREAILSKADENGLFVDVEVDLRAKGGDVKHVILSAQDIFVQDKKFRFTVVNDITYRKKAEQALKESEEKFRDMADLLPQVVFEIDSNGLLTYVNQQAHTVFGYEQDELIGLNSLAVHVPEERDRVLSSMTQKLSGSEIVNKEFKMLRKDGSVFPALIYINGIEKDGKNVGVRGVVIDITEQKIAEAKIRESESKYYELYTLIRLMSDTMPDMLWAKDLEGNYTFANKAMCTRLLHATDTNEPVGKPDTFFAKRERELHVENPKWHTFGEICADTDVTTIREMREMQFDEFGMVQGKFLFLDVHKAPLYNENNELIGIVGTARDITERKLAEEKLSFVTRLYALLSHINQAIVRIKNIDELLKTICELAIQYGQFRMCWVGVYNETSKQIVPYVSAGHVDGYLDNLVIVPGDEELGSGPTGRSYNNDTQIYCNDIETDPIMRPWKDAALSRQYRSSFSTPLYQSHKTFGTLTLYATEVNFFNEEEQHLLSEISENISYALDAIATEHERTAAEIALKDSEAKYRELMDNSPEGITIYVDGKVVYINKEALRLMRAKDKSEMMGKTVTDFIHPDNHEVVRERMKLVAMAPINSILPSVEEKYIRLDGTEVFVEIRVMPILYDGQPAIQLSGHDITDRKKAELALEQSQSELKTIYDHAPVMMCVVDRHRKIQFANEAFISLTGIAEDRMRGAPVGGVIGCINSFDEPRGCGYGSNCKSCTLRLAMEDTFTNGVEYQNVEYHSTLLVGSERKEVYLLGSTSLIQTTNQKQVLLCLHDITDRKLAEEALHKSEMLLRTFIDNTPFEIWARDIDSVGILENKKLTDHYGSIVGYTPQNDPRIDSDTLKLWEKNNARVFAGEVIDEEYEFKVRDEIRVFQQIVFPININNKIIGIAGFNIDITDRKIAEEKIHENSIKLEMAMQIANMAWWEMNIKTGDVVFGKRKTDMLDYRAENFTHYKHFTDLVHPEDHDKSIDAMKKHIYGTAEKYEVEYRIKNAAGIYKWFYDIGSVSKRDTDGNPLVISGVVLDITDRKHAEVTLKESQEQLKKFASHLQNVREEERVLLAREIHDQLGQILVAVKIDMGMLKLSVMKNIDKQKSIELLEKFDNLSALIDNTIKTARKIMTDLRPEVLDMLGFVETVNQHLNSFQERHKMQCSLETHISNLNLTNQQSVALFRIIQEALNNVAKHSKANQVKVVISENNNRLTLQVIDNGVGFDDKNKKKSDSYGLIGMKERVFLLEGELTISSQLGQGTVVKVEVPYQTMEQD